MIYQARTENSDVFIAMYETEEPKLENYPKTFKGSNQWIDDEREWQSSKREYKVRESEYGVIMELLYRDFLGSKSDCEMLYNNFLKSIEKGIDCTFLKNRLKLVNGYKIIDPQYGTKEDVAECTLLPLEDKKENDTEVWIELMQEWEEASNNLQESHILEYLKSKFILTRKPTIQEPE